MIDCGINNREKTHSNRMLRRCKDERRKLFGLSRQTPLSNWHTFRNRIDLLFVPKKRTNNNRVCSFFAQQPKKKSTPIWGVSVECTFFWASYQSNYSFRSIFELLPILFPQKSGDNFNIHDQLILNDCKLILNLDGVYDAHWYVFDVAMILK